ncbi:MAG TPA: hypothetical protein PK954_20660, partial [Anaerolineales bacterium]|nr:hypothetical protein [Anaerolineales bacterium]
MVLDGRFLTTRPGQTRRFPWRQRTGGFTANQTSFKRRISLGSRNEIVSLAVKIVGSVGQPAADRFGKGRVKGGLCRARPYGLQLSQIGLKAPACLMKR